MPPSTDRERTLKLARRFSMDELDRYAGICRVQPVMRPYLEVVA